MNFLKNIQDKIISIRFNTVVTYFSTPVGMYFVWIILHYISAHLYTMHCAPTGVWGFLLSPIMASTPYCTGLVWIMQNSVIKFMAIWTIVGSWINITLNKQEILENKPTLNTEMQTDTETEINIKED